jgi:hypothetical protein
MTEHNEYIPDEIIQRLICKGNTFLGMTLYCHKSTSQSEQLQEQLNSPSYSIYCRGVNTFICPTYNQFINNTTSL